MADRHPAIAAAEAALEPIINAVKDGREPSRDAQDQALFACVAVVAEVLGAVLRIADAIDRMAERA